jgi:DNA-binding transcriptional ArsR family regulator
MGVKRSVSMNQPLHRFKAELFKTLGHPLRIRILELLRSGEVSVRDLLRQLAAEPPAVSQQLGVLRVRGIVESRRADGTVYYRIRDPLITQLLDVGREVFGRQLLDLQSMLKAQEREDVMSLDRVKRRHAGRPRTRAMR